MALSEDFTIAIFGYVDYLWHKVTREKLVGNLLALL